MFRQVLDKPLPDFESFKRNVETWTKQRNEQGGISELAVYSKRCQNQSDTFISTNSLMYHRMDYYSVSDEMCFGTF